MTDGLLGSFELMQQLCHCSQPRLLSLLLKARLTGICQGIHIGCLLSLRNMELTESVQLLTLRFVVHMYFERLWNMERHPQGIHPWCLRVRNFEIFAMNSADMFDHHGIQVAPRLRLGSCKTCIFGVVVLVYGTKSRSHFTSRDAQSVALVLELDIDMLLPELCRVVA